MTLNEDKYLIHNTMIMEYAYCQNLSKIQNIVIICCSV